MSTTATSYVVHAYIGDVGPIICQRQYPRPDHLGPFTYGERAAAEADAARLQAKFPANRYVAAPVAA